MAGKALALLVVVGVVLGLAEPLHPGTVDAASHSAARSFNPDPVPPGGQLEVTITATGHGGIGQVTETLPPGFSYVSSDLSESAVTGDGQTFTFILLGDETFTYIVTAPETEGRYIFSGIIKDFEKDERPVGGASDIRVGVAPPPTPTPSPTAVPTPTPVPTLTPTPTLIPTREPTATPTPSPTPATTPVPATALMPTPIPAGEPTATPTPSPTPATTPVPATALMPTPIPPGEPTATPTAPPTPTPTLVPTPTPVAAAAAPGPGPTATAPAPPPGRPGEEGGLLGWLIVLIVAVAALLIGGGLGYALGRRR